MDIAYHRNKFIQRGFDRVIDVWGADHHGHAIRFGKSMTAPELGLEGKRLDFLIMQMVRLVRDGETVKVSKRSGKALTLNDLLDEIGVDACRFFFNAKPDTHLEFDLDLAIRQDSENPVYYVQYAHARICSLLASAENRAGAFPVRSRLGWSCWTLSLSGRSSSSWPCSRRRSCWRPGTTIPAASTGTPWSWRPGSTGSTMPAASGTRRQSSGTPGWF